MFYKDTQLDKEKENYENNKNNLSTMKNHNKVKYRVKNEIFEIYEWYNPVRILGSGAYAIVWYILTFIFGA